MYTKIKAQMWNIAGERREMAGSKPMEVDQVAAVREWPGSWCGGHSDQVEMEEGHDDENDDETCVQCIGNGGGKKGGKGFSGYSHACGEFGHSRWDCHMGKAKGKGLGKDGGYFQGHGKDGGGQQRFES